MEKNTLTNKLLDIAKKCYQGKVNDGIVEIGQIIPVLVKYIERCNESQSGEILEYALRPLLGAMDRKECTMIADIITYELIVRL